MINNELLQSRFFRKNDPITFQVGSQILNPAWWSRFYEYRWALDAALEYFKMDGEPVRLVMDAGCGVEHPFKWELLKHSLEVVAIDEDPGIRQVAIPDPRMKLLQTDLANFEYAEPFDAIFCISVLEHLDQHQLHRSLTNFHRLLRPGGCLILTFDYPSVNLDLVGMTLKSTGFKTFHCDYSRDDNTLNGLNSKCPNPDRLYLNVFRTFAVKPSDAPLPRRPS